MSELKVFLEKIETETSFFKYHLENNLKFISELNRYLENNNDRIVNNEEFWFNALESYHSYFPYIVNNSLLITFDSYFEDKFYMLINILSSNRVNNISQDKRISTIVRYFKHLNCNLNIAISKKNNEWIFINKMHKIRNLIVHHNSSLTDIKSIHSFRDSIDLDEITGKFYIIDVSLLSKYLDSINSFFNFVIAVHLA